MKTIKIGKRIEINIYPKEKRSKYQSISKKHPYCSLKYFYVPFDNEIDAIHTLISMKEIVKNYGVVSLAEVYELVGLHSSFKDTKRGWVNLEDALVLPAEEGHVLRLRIHIPI